MIDLVVHGHRGSRGTHPENTLPSFAEASSGGAAWIEFDIHLTRDGELVVFHDFDLSSKLCRHVNGGELAQPLSLRALTAAEIREYRIVALNHPAAEIPTLGEVLAWQRAHAPRLGLNIEIKRDVARADEPSASEIARRTLAEIRGFGGPVLVQSFDHDVVRALRAEDPRVRLSCLFEEKMDYAAIAQECRAQVVAIHYGLLDPATVQHCQAQGLEVLPWTVNRPEDWRSLYAMGIRSIITDYPRALVGFED